MGRAISDPINRNVLAAAMEIRPPTLSKIFDRKLFGYAIKHTIEPQIVYRYQTGIDNFSQILRLDQRDILADTNDCLLYTSIRKSWKRVMGSRSTSCLRSDSGR